MVDIGFLKQLDWLGELSEVEWRRLTTGASRQSFRVGAMVFQPSDEPHSVYLLEDGRVRIYRLSSEGDEATLGYVAPREVFGELPLFGNVPRESFAVAQVPSVVWKLSVDRFRALLRDRPSLVVEVTRQIGERLKRVESRVESLIFGNVRARLATMLVELADDFGKRQAEGVTLDLKLSQTELATLIGASRQSVNSALSEFREAGWVVQQEGTLVLVRPELLRSAIGDEEA